MAAELAGWASSELPGQASYRPASYRPAPNLPAAHYGPMGDTAGPNGGRPTDTVF